LTRLSGVFFILDITQQKHRIACGSIQISSSYISRFSFAFDEDVPAIRKQKLFATNPGVALGVKTGENREGAANREQTITVRNNRAAIFEFL